jgi:hypothetical protein
MMGSEGGAERSRGRPRHRVDGGPADLADSPSPSSPWGPSAGAELVWSKRLGPGLHLHGVGHVDGTQPPKAPKRLQDARQRYTAARNIVVGRTHLSLELNPHLLREISTPSRGGSSRWPTEWRGRRTCGAATAMELVKSRNFIADRSATAPPTLARSRPETRVLGLTPGFVIRRAHRRNDRGAKGRSGGPPTVGRRCRSRALIAAWTRVRTPSARQALKRWRSTVRPEMPTSCPMSVARSLSRLRN